MGPKRLLLGPVLLGRQRPLIHTLILLQRERSYISSIWAESFVWKAMQGAACIPAGFSLKLIFPTLDLLLARVQLVPVGYVTVKRSCGMLLKPILCLVCLYVLNNVSCTCLQWRQIKASLVSS